MQLEGMIFDFDGTLADTMPLCFAAFRTALQAYTGRRYSDDELILLFGPTEEGIIRRLVPDRWEECLALYLETYEREHERYAALFPGMKKALDLLDERGVALAIVTGKGEGSAALSLERLELKRTFPIVEAGSPQGPVKPAAIRRILDAWGVSGQRVAYVGDVPSDMDAAHASGVLAIGAAWADTADAGNLAARHPFAVFPTAGHFVTWIEREVQPGNRSPGKTA